jgi:SAM-dependent methyltransferase
MFGVDIFGAAKVFKGLKDTAKAATLVGKAADEGAESLLKNADNAVEILRKKGNEIADGLGERLAKDAVDARSAHPKPRDSSVSRATPEPPITTEEIDAALERGFRGEGPMVNVRGRQSGLPHRTLEVGSGPTQTNLGIPEKPSMSLLRTDINRAFPIDEVLDAQGRLPDHFVESFDTVIINNPRGHLPNLNELGRALRPGGRIIIQGNTLNSDFKRAIKTARTPTGFAREVDFSAGRDLPPNLRSDPEAIGQNIMGGPFSRTSGEASVSPNRRIIYTKPE